MNWPAIHSDFVFFYESSRVFWLSNHCNNTILNSEFSISRSRSLSSRALIDDTPRFSLATRISIMNPSQWITLLAHCLYKLFPSFSWTLTKGNAELAKVVQLSVEPPYLEQATAFSWGKPCCPTLSLREGFFESLTSRLFTPLPSWKRAKCWFPN